MGQLTDPASFALCVCGEHTGPSLLFFLRKNYVISCQLTLSFCRIKIVSLLLLTITINQKTPCMKLNEICMILKRKDGDCRMLCVCVPVTVPTVSSCENTAWTSPGQ